MKNSFIIKSIICLILLNFKAQASKLLFSDSNKICLEITGKLTRLGDRLTDHYEVQLIRTNSTVESITVKDKESFTFQLDKNSHYAIRIAKKGFVPRLISIHTDLPKGNKKIYRFEFDSDLIPLRESGNLKSDALDFPIAIISFDYAMKFFNYNEEYTSYIKRQIYKVN